SRRFLIVLEPSLLGKVRAKLFCRDYTRGTSRRRNAAIEQLEREVLEMERRLAADPEDPSLCGACREKREELRALEDHRARGAFVRSRIRLLREMDRGSRFFYALEKTRGAKKHVTCLLAEDGTPLTGPEEMCGRARDFYTSLFSPDPTDPDACEVLWEELPTVSVGDRDRLELPLTLAEFSEALRRMPTNKSPGMDGLTVEFYRAFWDILGPDLVTVWAESLQSGVLPLSCRRAVLALLPKRGDLRDLRNWRPVSLLSTDYKIVAKAISLRLGSVMADVVHPDQTYTVPGRSIFDNLFLVRDLLELGRRDGLSFALLSLDQEKAFDRVDHGYLLSTLRAFGLGPQFVSFLRVLYASAECLVRLNWTLTEPVSFGRGVRQGCPLSGQLYALAIEPFLCLLRRRLTGLVLREPELRLVLSAYADDVLLVVQDPGDLARVEACQAIFSAASSARVNWVKSSGWAVGGWRQNWQNLEGGVIERIRKWTRLLRCLSLRGRALVLNQLVLSTLWYRLNTLAPAPGFLSHLRRLILEFFWSGLHWAPVGVLHLPLKEGGQGLKCLYTQVRVFRLQALQRLLYSFPRDLSGLPDFYQDLLRAWKLFSTTRSVAAIVGADLLTEPLLHNPQLCVQAAESRTVRQRLVLAGVTRVGDLLDYDRGDWLDPLTLARRMGLSSLRTPRRVLQEVEAALTPAARAYVSRALCEGAPRPSLTPGPPDLSIGPLLCRSQHTPHPFTASRLHELQPVGFQVASRKYLYTLTLHTLHARTLVSRPDTKWRDLLPPLEGEQPRWASLYSTLVPRPVGDISWRLLHGASRDLLVSLLLALAKTAIYKTRERRLAHEASCDCEAVFRLSVHSRIRRGKVRAKLFCRDYTRGTSRRRNAAIEQLEREVLEMERRLAADPEDPSLCGACREKREELRALEDHRARGAFVRSRIRLLREMDRGSRFFYALEKTRGAKKHVTCLLAEDGTPLTGPEEMCGRARDFYTSLFSPDPTDPDACEVLWEELPTVSVGDRDRLELPLTLAEFSEALRRMPTNKSPGMDGLTVEFYRAFWDILGPDLVTVWAESLQSGVLPLSCRRAVLALLPKRGDLRDLRNWRPVSLLSTDYKIVAKAISLRLGSVMADVVHPDQTYTVPGRSIFDNLFLVRDLLELGRRDGLSFALLSLDQEKAFDRVDHGYLLSTLRAFGLGPQFVSFLRVLYASAECLVRLNWTLTEPVSFGRGVRRLTGLVLREPELRLVLSAYADDVLLVVQDPGDLARVEACQAIFSAASSARVNWVKSSGLAVGGWRQGKVRAKLFCRDYTRGTSRRRNAAIEQLEREVLEMERRLAADPEDPSLCGACREKREELRALEDHRARGAFVRSRIRLLREMDRGSRFFYALEKTRGAKKHVTCLLAEDGTPLTGPEEMCGRARDFYTSLFSPDPTDPDACEVLWEELPTVSVGDRDRLELPLTLAEFSEALRRMPTNKSPGMDGLTVEFYRAFWDILGPDLVTVWAESLQSGVLPLSCRRAVLALLPKRGDLRDLRNWRPVSLLSTDYKIVAKAISLRLGSVMADVVHPDQTYTVPGRSIFDNLFLVRDLLELGRRDVDHGYLLSTLQAFGFGPRFGRMTGLVLREPELRLVLSAYADDVLLVVQDPGDLARVEACQAIYSAASSARVNWVKSSGLAVGDWRQ
ncbi:unnamed protein product, partial [Lepidochelys olivacea]